LSQVMLPISLLMIGSFVVIIIIHSKIVIC
jgi:hypothetical protein